MYKYLAVRAELTQLRLLINQEMRQNAAHFRVFIERFRQDDKDLLVDVFIKDIVEKGEPIQVPVGVDIPSTPTPTEEDKQEKEYKQEVPKE